MLVDEGKSQIIRGLVPENGLYFCHSSSVAYRNILTPRLGERFFATLRMTEPGALAIRIGTKDFPYTQRTPTLQPVATSPE